MSFLRRQDLRWTYSRSGFITKRHNSLLHYHLLFFLSQTLLLTAFCLGYVSRSNSPSQQFSDFLFPQEPSHAFEQFTLCLTISIVLHMSISILSITLLQITWLSSNLEFVKTYFKLYLPKNFCIWKFQCHFFPIKIINHVFQHSYLQQALSDCKFIIYFCTLSSDSLPVSYIKKVLVHIVFDIYLIVTAHWDVIIQPGEELLLPTPSLFICTQLVVLCYWFITFAHFPTPGTVHSALFSCFVFMIKSPEVKSHWATCVFYTCLRDAVCCESSRSLVSPCLQQGKLAYPLSHPHEPQASLVLSSPLPHVLIPQKPAQENQFCPKLTQGQWFLIHLSHSCANARANPREQDQEHSLRPPPQLGCSAGQGCAGLKPPHNHSPVWCDPTRQALCRAQNSAPPLLEQSTAWPCSSWNQRAPSNHFHSTWSDLISW